MAARWVIIGALLALAAGVGVAGAESAHRQLGSNLVQGDAFNTVLEGGQRLCQERERVPAGTSALRLTIGTDGEAGPPLELRIQGGGVQQRGGLAAGWREGAVVIPVEEARDRRSATVCLRNAGNVPIVIAGEPFDRSVGARVAGERTDGRVRIEYTTADERSWWDVLGAIDDRMAAVRVGFPASATMWLWVGLLGLVVAGVVVVVLLPVPKPGLAVTLIALASALAWGLVVPPFQVPDEPAHFYYATYLGRTGELPRNTPEDIWYSQRLNRVLTAMEFPRIAGRPHNRAPWSDSDRAAVEAQERGDFEERGFGDAATASTNSPLYYVLQAAVDRLSPSPAVLDRLALMRILGAILSALTVASVFAFLRELLPSSPWSATVGALAAALQPLFGFISSGVNNDGLLYLCSALLLFAVARAFRRGLTPRRAALIGGSLAVGVLVKAQLIAFAPAVAIACAVLLLRRRGRGDAVWRPLAAVAAAAAAPLLVYFVLGQTVWERPAIDRVGTLTSAAASSPNLTGMVSYVWQSYLPRPPFLYDWFDGFALKRVWIDGLVGRFGWLDYTFPAWVRTLGALALLLVAAGAGATLLRRRDAVRRRAAEAVTYGAAAVAFAIAVALAGYLSRLSSGQPFEQARYLLPLLPLYAAAVALAVHALGRRWAGVLGCAIVMATLAHTVFAQLLTLTRYYG